jgi:hypothetical protein
MKVTWSDLSAEEQATFGNGCTWVPDFIFTARCTQHDFNYTRGGYLFAKIKADYDLCVRMFDDAFAHRYWYLYMWVGVIYFLGLAFLPFSYFKFTWGRWRIKEEILAEDRRLKQRATM